jgi:hypothetical protein
MIGEAVKRATDVPDGVKLLFREVLAWNEATVDQVADLDDRLDSAEAALDELLDGSGEMLLPETAAVITSAFEHAQLLCTASLALFEGPLATMDEVTKKRFVQLIDNVQRAIALANQTVTDLTDDVEEEDDADDGSRDGDGERAGDDAADGDGDDEGEEDEAG